METSCDRNLEDKYIYNMFFFFSPSLFLLARQSLLLEPESAVFCLISAWAASPEAQKMFPIKKKLLIGKHQVLTIEVLPAYNFEKFSGLKGCSRAMCFRGRKSFPEKGRVAFFF